MEQTRKFTIAELSEFNGKNGKPAYVGCKGKVYDVTASDQWLEGGHVGHMAGQNLTEEMEIAPHGGEAFGEIAVIEWR